MIHLLADHPGFFAIQVA